MWKYSNERGPEACHLPLLWRPSSHWGFLFRRAKTANRKRPPQRRGKFNLINSSNLTLYLFFFFNSISFYLLLPNFNNFILLTFLHFFFGLIAFLVITQNWSFFFYQFWSTEISEFCIIVNGLRNKDHFRRWTSVAIYQICFLNILITCCD